MLIFQGKGTIFEWKRSLTKDKGSENASIRAKHGRTGISCERMDKSGDEAISEIIMSWKKKI